MVHAKRRQGNGRSIQKQLVNHTGIQEQIHNRYDQQGSKQISHTQHNTNRKTSRGMKKTKSNQQTNKRTIKNIDIVI